LSARKFFIICRRNLRLRRPAQIALILAFWVAGDFLVRRSGLPIPGGIAGMILALGLLACGWIRPASLRQGANWFLAEMLLFFVPAVLAILDHREFLGLLGLKILAAILLGTTTVMVATALAVELCFRLLYASDCEQHAGD
jgi:holin-like protein